MPPLEREAPWLARARHGDRGAFDEIVRLHYSTVHAFLLRQTRSRPEAEDLAQETFVRAWRALASFDERRPLGAWLTRIAWNLFLDRERVRVRRGVMSSLDEPSAAAASCTQDADPRAIDPHAHESERELDAALDAAIAQLPEPLRLAFVLRVLEGREYDEVAVIAGVKPATARTQVAAARARLERALAPFLEQRS